MDKFKQGWEIVGGQKYYFKSGFEARWAKYLETLKGMGIVKEWFYEPHKFEFEKIRSGTVFYTPDFFVQYPNGEMLWHETKGHLTQKDVTKFRRMAKYYPDEKIVLVMQNIPAKHTRKNTEKFRRLGNARKYVERIIFGSKVLKQIGL